MYQRPYILLCINFHANHAYILHLYSGYILYEKQLSTTVASRVQCSSRRESPPAAGPVVDDRRHPRRKS